MRTIYPTTKTRDMERQIATTSEQSSRLLRCGVSADTADMIGIEPNYGYECEPWSSMQGQDTRGYFPAWSLSALFGLLPKVIDIDGYAYRISIYFESPEEPVIGNQWCLYYKPVKYTEKSRIDDVAMYAENLLECTVLMAEYLYEHGYKLNESKE